MSIIVILFAIVFFIAVLVPLIVGTVFLIIRHVRKKSAVEPIPAVSPTEPVPPVSAEQKSLAQALKDHRLQSGMTQELVAEKLEVSRQAVSKWENGTSEPSTANLIALAQLYGVDVGELLKDVHN